jgi:hypothetical protein
LASIDAFWELAANEPAPKPVLRMSLVRLGSAASSNTNPSDARQRRLILLGVALLHVLFLLILREAMRPVLPDRSRASVPMQITFIERRPALKRPKPSVPVPPSPRPRQPAVAQTVARRPDTSPVLTIVAAPQPVEVAPPKAALFDSDGALRAPPASTSDHPRDLLAHRDASFMLPGGARKNSPDFHVRDDPSPQGVVNSIGLGISKSMGIAFAARPDTHGVLGVAPDRGVRTSDRDSDPCQDLAQDRLDPSDEKARDEAEARYEKACE